MTRRRRGLTDRLLASGLLQTFGLDALLAAALIAIGVSVYRLSADLLGGYVGLVALAAWWSIGKSTAKDPKANG